MLRLGGPEPHGRRSGVVHILTETPRRRRSSAPARLTDPARRPGQLDVTAVEDRDLSQLLPESKKRAYDVHPLVEGVLDEGPSCQENCTSGGRPTSSPPSAGSAAVRSASSPTTRSGSAAASTHCPPRRRRGSCGMCDAFGVPLVVLVDVPGYLPGVGQEWDGVVRRGREAAARLRRVRRPPGDAGDPEDVRRRLHRDELRVARRDPGLRLARGRGGRDGCRRRGPDPAPAQAGRGRPRTSGRRSRPSWPPSTSGSPAASRRAVEIGVVDEVVEPDPHPLGAGHRAGEAPRPAAAIRGRARQHPAVNGPERLEGHGSVDPCPSRGAAAVVNNHRGCPDTRWPSGHGPSHPCKTSDAQSHRKVRGKLRRSPLSSQVLRIRSDNLVQPAHGRAVAGVPEGLQLVVPGATEQACSTSSVRSASPLAAFTHGRLQPLLRHHDVAVHAGGRVEDAELGRERVPLALDAVAGLLGDLEPQLASSRAGRMPAWPRCRPRPARTARPGTCPGPLAAVSNPVSRARQGCRPRPTRHEGTTLTAPCGRTERHESSPPGPPVLEGRLPQRSRTLTCQPWRTQLFFQPVPRGITRHPSEHWSILHHDHLQHQ